MSNEEARRGQRGQDRWTEDRRRQRHQRHQCRVEVVTVRQPGTRYPTQCELNRMRDKMWHGVSGRKLFLRFLFSFILAVLVGMALLLFGITFIAQAKDYQDKQQSSIPVVFCVLSIVLGILMHLGAIVLAHYMITNRLWLQLRSSGTSRRRTSSSSNQALRPNDSCSSLGPPDPEDAPPLYSSSHHHALALPTMQLISADHLLATPVGGPVTPPVLFVLPSYEEIVNQKVPSNGDSAPPAYCEEEKMDSNQETDTQETDIQETDNGEIETREIV